MKILEALKYLESNPTNPDGSEKNLTALMYQDRDFLVVSLSYDPEDKWFTAVGCGGDAFDESMGSEGYASGETPEEVISEVEGFGDFNENAIFKEYGADIDFDSIGEFWLREVFPELENIVNDSEIPTSEEKALFVKKAKELIDQLNAENKAHG